jgi:predicted metal-binding membrane protein
VAHAPTLESFLRRDRTVVAVALFAVTAIAWIDLVYMARDMNVEGGVMEWGIDCFTAMFVMWMVMMVGMMIPSAAPAILLFSSLRRHSSTGSSSSTTLFALGYIVVWGAFSLIATLAQWALSEQALLSSSMKSEAPWLTAVLLIAAGTYQFSPLKKACLSKCRSPAQFLVEHWREGRLGSVVVGAKHGAYCVGCCWALMGLLFVFGVMNLLWIALLAAFVLLEKLFPSGPRISAWSGIAMVLIGLLFLNF